MVINGFFLDLLKASKRLLKPMLICGANMRQTPNTPEEHKPFKRAIEVWNKNIEKDCLPDISRQRSIISSIGKDFKWHSQRKPKKSIDKRGIYGLDGDFWHELHLKWRSARIDSPKYVDGSPFSITVWLIK